MCDPLQPHQWSVDYNNSVHGRGLNHTYMIIYMEILGHICVLKLGGLHGCMQ